MSVLNLLKIINRKHWFICHACLMNNNHDARNAIFYQNTPGEDFMGRMMFPCPRCANTNTRSFAQLKREGSEQALFGLEQIVREHPRSAFTVKPAQKPAA